MLEKLQSIRERALERLNQAADLREASLATWSELYYTIRIINHKIYKTYPEYA